MTSRQVAITGDVKQFLSYGEKCVVAIGVSGGKDSCAVALATHAYLKRIEFPGEIVLIHSDLGKVEWKQSLPKCEEMAQHLGVELITVARKAGGMLERWQSRWDANVARYENLECVKLILPWSTPSMRFCTSELKVAVITAELKKRYNGYAIINVTGIRRQESANRAKKPVSTPSTKLSHKTVNPKTGMSTKGLDWNPIIEWTVDEVFAAIEEAGLEPHEAYTKYGMSRVSCAFCILSNAADMLSATKAKQNRSLYREQVELEIKSTFSFQQGWLGDVAPHLLSSGQRKRLEEAKVKAAKREELESRIPKHLVYVKGWPVVVPTLAEATLLADARTQINDLLGLSCSYTTPTAVIKRYKELMEKVNV